MLRVVFLWCISSGLLLGAGAKMEYLGEEADVVGAALYQGKVVVATANGLWLRESEGKFTTLWRAPQPGTINHGPLVVDGTLWLVVRNQLLASPVGDEVAFSAVPVGAAVLELPRRVHDRWLVWTENDVRQSRDLRKWEPVAGSQNAGIRARHVTWHDNAWWALMSPPPEAPSGETQTEDGPPVEEGEGNADDYPPYVGGMLVPGTFTYELRRSTDLKNWTTVREVEASLTGGELYSYGSFLVETGEAGVRIIPTNPTEEVVIADASEWIRDTVVLNRRLWISTDRGLLVADKSDPTTWQLMNEREFLRVVQGQVSVVAALGQDLVLGTTRGRVALLSEDAQAQLAETGSAFEKPAGYLADYPPPNATKQLVSAAGKIFAITYGKTGLLMAEPGQPWRSVAAFGQQVNSIAAVGDRVLAVVDYTGVMLWDAAAGRSLTVAPPPEKSFSTVQAVNGRFFGISSAGHLAELGVDGQWQPITLPSDDPNFGVRALAYYDGHFLVSPVREAGLYRTADFQKWTYAPMQGGNTRIGLLFNTGRRLLAVQHFGEREKDDTPVGLAVSTDGVAWQEIAGIVTARDSYFHSALHDGRRHVLVFTRELWVSEGDEALAWRRVPVEQNSYFELSGDRLVAATAEGLMVRDAGAQTAIESAPTRVVRSLATTTSWQAAGPAAVAERKRQEALAKATAEAIPPTVSGAVVMAGAFHHFEQLYVSGAPRKDLAQQAVGVHEAVRKHRPHLANEVAEVLSVLVVNLEVRDAHTTAFLAHHLPGFRNKVQARYGKIYSQIYWSLRRRPGSQPVNEYEVDVMKELLMSHTDNSYLRRVTYPKIPKGYPNYDSDKPRKPVEFAAVTGAPFDVAAMQKNLVEKGWAGAALDRDVMHANKLQIEASTDMRHVWLLAARVLWPGTPPANANALLERSMEEKARLGSLFAADGLALDARKAGRTDEFTRYRDLAVQRGMQASRYVSYAEQMADALRGMNEANRNMATALGDYADQLSAVADQQLAAAVKERDDLLKSTNQKQVDVTGDSAGRVQPTPAVQPAAATTDDGEVLTPSARQARDLTFAMANGMPPGPERDQALAKHKALWGEKVRYRRLAKDLLSVSVIPDVGGVDAIRGPALQRIAETSKDIFETTPKFMENSLTLVGLVGIADKKIPRERHAETLDGILEEVPTLSEVWALRARLHFEAGEFDLARGKLDVARLLNPKLPAVAQVERMLSERKTQQASVVNDAMREIYERSIKQVELGDAAFAQGSYATAKEHWQGAAKSGNDEADLRLALLYAEGLGVTKDVPRALTLAEKAKGSSKTQNRATVLVTKLPMLMKTGVSAHEVEQVRKEIFKAVGLTFPAVNPETEFQLGREFEDGRRGSSSQEQMAGAITAYRRASDLDHVDATMALVGILNKQRLEIEQKDDGGGVHGTSQLVELNKEISERILRASRLGNGEALRIHALWIGQGQMGGDVQTNAQLALVKLEKAAEAGDLIAMRLLIRAAQAGEWKPPAADTVEKFVEKLAAAGEADAKLLIQQRDQQRKFDREFWGERGVPMADPKAITAAVPAEALVLQGAPRSLVAHLQLARPAATAARSYEAARALVIAMLGDERIDAKERAFLGEVVKPSFRVKVVVPTDAHGPAREVEFRGSYQPQARAFIERFIPPAGSDQPSMTPLMQRYFWIWTGVNGWKRAIAHAESSPNGRREMIDVLKGWLAEKWSTSNTANQFGPIRDELISFKTMVAQLPPSEYNIGRGLLYESCQELDKSLNDAMPEYLYWDFKEASTESR